MSKSDQAEILPTYNTQKVEETVTELQISINVNQESLLSILSMISVVSSILCVVLGNFYRESPVLMFMVLIFGNVCLNRVSKIDSASVKSVWSVVVYTLFVLSFLFLAVTCDFFGSLFLVIACISGCLLSLLNLYISFKQKNE